MTNTPSPENLEPEPATEGAAETRQAPREYVGLLTQLMTETMDADYGAVHRTEPSRPKKGIGSAGGVLAVAALFGLMLGVSALQTEQARPQADAERAELVDQIHDRQDGLDALHGQLTDLEDELATLQREISASVNSDRSVAAELSDLGVAAGSVAVTGPGMVITADDADSSSGPGGVILDTDLQTLVNALWASGAEAIAVDGHRLTSLTSIRYAGQAITVDYRSLTTPYVITAVGDPDTLPARLLQTPGGQTWLGLRANFGITFETAVKDKLTIAADPHDHLLYAKETVSAP